MDSQQDAAAASADRPAVPDAYAVGATSVLSERRLHTLKHGDMFGVFDQSGNILHGPGIADGIYLLDTRHLSALTLTLQGAPPILLSSALRDNNATLSCDLTNPDMKLLPDGGMLAHDLLHLRRTHFLWHRTCYKRLVLRNYDVVARRTSVEIGFAADFADLFEARGTPRARHGEMAAPVLEPDSVLLAYEGLDRRVRSTRLRFEPRPDVLTESSARLALVVAPGARGGV